MLPEVGATELLVIAAIALIVVGPKDLPIMLRKLGQFLGRMRAMANDFRASFEDMARQSELDELRREVEAMRSGRYFREDDSTEGASQVFADIHAGLTGEPAAPVLEAEPKPELELEPAPKPKKPRAPRKKKPEAKA